MGKAKKITVGFKYYMGLFFGLSRGPVNALTEIRVGDRTAWKGNVTDTTSIGINAEDLFGGTKAEGGVKGTLEVYMGKPNQTISAKLRRMLGGKQPQYRGIFSAYFDGMVSAMSPYPKHWKFKMWRTTAGWSNDVVWYPAKCTINLEGFDGQGNKHPIHAMNPAHIIYECQTNFEWGRGLDPSLVDEVSFRKAADQLFDEQFGLCITWKRQDLLGTFIKNVLDHIGGALYVSKVTGKVTLKLIRDDFDVDTLPIFDMDSGLLSITEATNASPAAMINEVVVNYRNPIIDEDQQVRAHNLAQIQNQGCLNSTTVDYVGIPTGKIAMQVCQRDLRVASTNVRRFTIVCDRRAWNIQPADVIKLRDPKSRGLNEVIVRVGTVEDGTLPDGKIKIVGVQDQFAFRLNTFNDVQEPDGYKPDLKPAIARRIVYEMPYVDLVQQIPEGELNTIKPTDTFINSQAEKPTPMSAAYDMGFMADGETKYDVRGNGDFGAFASIRQTVDRLDEWIYVDELNEMWDDVEPGYVARIASVINGLHLPMDIREEFVRIDEVDTLQRRIKVARGTLDTIPFQHFVGDLIWVTTLDGGSDWQRYAGTEEVDVKILPWTLGGGRFPIEDAPVDHVILNSRQTRPYAPGNVIHTLASDPTERHWFTPTILTYTANAGETPDVFNLSWAHRDRILQADKAIAHQDGDIGPETGVSYTIEVFTPDGTLVRNETGIQGTSWRWAYQTAANDVKVEEATTGTVMATLRLHAVRNGYRSWEYYEIKVNVYKKPPQYTYTANLDHFAVQPYNAASDPNPTPSIDGANVSSLMHMAAAEASGYVDMDGGNVAGLPHQVTQESDIITPLDTRLYETAYIVARRDNKPDNVSTVSALVARSSDRTVDSYSLFTRHEADTDYLDAGIQAWTPWGMTAVGLSYFNDEVTFNDTSDKDGVPLAGAMVGDLLLIDQEIVVILGIQGRTYKIGRGAADTIPAQHYSDRPVWLMSMGYGWSPMTFANDEKALAVIRPTGHDHDIPLSKLYPLQLKMQDRTNRPYPPGLMMIGGQPFFNTASGLGADFDPYNNLTAKDVMVTYAHRNRITQDTTAKDHFAVGIGLEPGTHYRVRIGYNWFSDTPDANGSRTRYVLLKEFTTEDAGFKISAAELKAWGYQAGRAQEAAGWAILIVAVNAERDGLLNWQGYTMTVTAPSYPVPPGTKPGGSNGGGNNNGGGTTPPTRPGGDGGTGGGSNPGGGGNGGNTGGGNDGQEPKPPVDPVDPEDPNTKPPVDPVDPPPDPTNVPGWSLSWDHGWALTALPDQRYIPTEFEVKQ